MFKFAALRAIKYNIQTKYNYINFSLVQRFSIILSNQQIFEFDVTLAPSVKQFYHTVIYIVQLPSSDFFMATHELLHKCEFNTDPNRSI